MRKWPSIYTMSLQFALNHLLKTNYRENSYASRKSALWLPWMTTLFTLQMCHCLQHSIFQKNIGESNLKKPSKTSSRTIDLALRHRRQPIAANLSTASLQPLLSAAKRNVRCEILRRQNSPHASGSAIFLLTSGQISRIRQRAPIIPTPPKIFAWLRIINSDVQDFCSSVVLSLRLNAILRDFIRIFQSNFVNLPHNPYLRDYWR